MRATLVSSIFFLSSMRSTLPGKAGAAHLAAQEQVLGNRHGRGHGQVLVHGFDAGVARVDRALEVDRLAVEQDLASSGWWRPTGT
jgi:hypothetical protein